MKKFVFIILVLVVSVYLFGYAKEEQHTTTAPKVSTKTETALPRPLTESIRGGLTPSAPLEVTDARVKDIQNALMILGYYRGPIDGEWGPLTKKAVENFQKANNLQVDGKVGKKTWASLRVQAIQKIQTNLKNAGYYTVEIDGEWGPLTKKAVENFQKANNLQVDGKVGPKTWDKLSHYLNDLMAKHGCLSIYDGIYKIMNDEYYKDVSREEFEKFIDEVKSVFNQNKIWQQDELRNFKYKSPADLVIRLKDPQDKYSYFYVGEEAKQIEQTALGYEEGLGIEGQLIDKGFKVIEVEPRSDSFEKGLRENDIIIKINNEFVKNLTNDQIDKKLLKAEPHMKVNLRIISHQDNQEKLLKDVTCKKFDKKTSFLIKTREPDIFCIKIKYFNKMIFDDLNEILDGLKDKLISGIILDFQDNNGGILDFRDNMGGTTYIVENLAGYFIVPGKRLYYIKTKLHGQKEFFSKEPKYRYTGPLIGLMNKNTASTAELILGAFRIYHRITLVGQNSLGAGHNKGFKSGYIEDKKWFFILLTSVFYLSDESTFDKTGLKPDYEILDNEQVLSKAVDILVKRKGGKRDTP